MSATPISPRRAAAILATILLFSLSSPLHTTETVAIDPPMEQSLTSNNTGEDSSVQTLVSNLNIYDPADITGTVDSLDRAHVVWVQGLSLIHI